MPSTLDHQKRAAAQDNFALREQVKALTFQRDQANTRAWAHLMDLVAERTAHEATTALLAKQTRRLGDGLGRTQARDARRALSVAATSMQTSIDIMAKALKAIDSARP